MPEKSPPESKEPEATAKIKQIPGVHAVYPSLKGIATGHGNFLDSASAAELGEKAGEYESHRPHIKRLSLNISRSYIQWLKTMGFMPH